MADKRIKDLSNGGFPVQNTANGSKTSYPKSGQFDGAMTRSPSGVSKATGSPKVEFAQGGGSSPHPTYPKKGQEGTNTMKPSVAAPPSQMPKAR